MIFLSKDARVPKIIQKSPGLDFGLNEDKKQEFDKVQGLLVSDNINPKPKEKRKKRFGAHEDIWPHQMYEIQEKSTKEILVVPMGTTECPKASQEEEAEEIGEAIAKEIIKEEEEEKEESTECNGGKYSVPVLKRSLM